MKPVQKIAFKPYCLSQVGSLLGKRSHASLEDFAEHLVSKRHKVFVPSDFDLTDYDSVQLKKQIEFDKMTIKITDTKSSETPTGIKRYVTRQEDMEAKFRRLNDELESIAKQYSREIDEIYTLFEEVGCSKDQLKKLLLGHSYMRWSELEDMALQSKDPRQVAYIIKTKGQEEVDRRVVFLSITL